MRLPDSWRAPLEWLLRALVIIALGVALVRSLTPPRDTAAPIAASTHELPAALNAVSTNARVSAVQLEIDSLPGAVHLAWLAALSHAGVPVKWRGSPRPLALEVARTADPVSRVRLLVVTDSGAPLALRDSAGVLDTLARGARGSSLESAALVGRVMAASERWAASVAVPPPPGAPRAVLVLGRAGWESKFVSDALHEAGWTVRAVMPIAPGVAVRDPALLPLDTSRYAVVVALDSTARDLARDIVRFVGDGGGLVLAGTSPNAGVLRTLSSAQTGPRETGRAAIDGDSVTLRGLPVRPLVALRDDAVRLEGRSATPLVAVRRAGLGRVLTLGYDETWRWRMMGGANGAAAHRSWWSHTVALVAPQVPASNEKQDAAAPVAALYAALGPPTTEAEVKASSRRHSPLPVLLLGLIVVALLAETASRRFRGAR